MSYPPHLTPSVGRGYQLTNYEEYDFIFAVTVLTVKLWCHISKEELLNSEVPLSFGKQKIKKLKKKINK